MREFRRLHRRCVAFRRQVGASLVLASLLALFLGQPFHATAPFGAPQQAPATTTVAVASSTLPSQAAAHDADLCSMCRATAQTRLGLRSALRLGEIAADRPCLALHLPAPVPVKAAPLLRQAQPRAPPASLPLLQA